MVCACEVQRIQECAWYILSWVIVVEHDFDDLVLGQDKGIGVAAVDGRIGGVGASGEDAVERRYLGAYVGHVVEEGTDVDQQKVQRHGYMSLTSLRRHSKRPSSYPA